MAYRPIPIGDVLSPKLWKANFVDGAFFKDKIVLIGPAAEIFHDEHPTPFVLPRRNMPGPELHLNILNAALHREFLTEPSLAANLLMILLAGTVAVAIFFLIQQPIRRLAAMAFVIFAYWLLAVVLFSAAPPGRWILLGTPIITLLLSGITSLTYDYFLERLEKRRVRSTLERYVSRDVVSDLLDNPQTYFNALGGVRQPGVHPLFRYSRVHDPD